MEKIDRWAERVIELGLVMAVAVTPLIWMPWTSELFQTNKMYWVYVWAIVVAGAGGIKALSIKYQVSGIKRENQRVLTEWLTALRKLIPGRYFRINETSQPPELKSSLDSEDLVLTPGVGWNLICAFFGRHKVNKPQLLEMPNGKGEKSPAIKSVLLAEPVEARSIEALRLRSAIINKGMKFPWLPWLGLFLLSQVISIVWSIDRHVSVFGYYGRFNGGLLSSFAYVFLSLAAVAWLTKEKAVRIVKVSLLVAVMIALYGIGEHNGIDARYWVQDVRHRIFATMGQPNWLAAYLAMWIPVSLGISISKIKHQKSKIQIKNQNNFISRIKTRWVENREGKSGFKPIAWGFDFAQPRRWGYFLSFSILYLALLYTRSRSGFLGLVVGLWVFGVILIVTAVRKNMMNHIPTTNSRTRQHLVPTENLVTRTMVFIRRYMINHIPTQTSQRLVATRSLATILGASLLVLVTLGLLSSTPFTPSVFDWVRDYKTQRLQNEAAPRSYTSNDKETEEGEATETGPLIVTPSEDIRLIVWRGAIEAWKHRPVTGFGVETFAWAYYKYRPVEHNLTSEWDFLYNKAHNEYLNLLTTSGVLGVGTYLLLIGCFLGWFVKQVVISTDPADAGERRNLIHSRIPNQVGNDKTRSLDSPDEHRSSLGMTYSYLALGLFAGWVSLLVSNFFGFSTVTTGLGFFMFPALTWVLIREEEESLATEEPGDREIEKVEFRGLKRATNASRLIFGRIVNRFKGEDLSEEVKGPTKGSAIENYLNPVRKVNPSRLASAVIIGVTAFGLWLVVSWWRADLAYKQAEDYNREGKLSLALSAIRKALQLRPDEPIYADELADITSQLAKSSAGELTKEIEAEADTGAVVSEEVKVTPGEDMGEDRLAGTYKLTKDLADLAIQASNQALASSPNNVNFWKSRELIFLELADTAEILESEDERVNKEANRDNDAQFLMDEEGIQGGMIEEVDALKEAKKALEVARQLSPTDPKIVYNLALVAAREGDHQGAIKLAEQALELKPNYQDGLLAAAVFSHDEAIRDGQVVNPESLQTAIGYLEKLNNFYPDEAVKERLEKWRGEIN
jgi:tetratricopeptide (TPR) repeat protein